MSPKKNTSREFSRDRVNFSTLFSQVHCISLAVSNRLRDSLATVHERADPLATIYENADPLATVYDSADFLATVYNI
jgi:hypothetical protein